MKGHSGHRIGVALSLARGLRRAGRGRGGISVNLSAAWREGYGPHPLPPLPFALRCGRWERGNSPLLLLS